MSKEIIPKISDLMAAWLGREDHTDSPFLRDPVTGKMQLRYDELRFERYEVADGSVYFAVTLLHMGQPVHTYTTDKLFTNGANPESVNLPGLTGLVSINMVS